MAKTLTETGLKKIGQRFVESIDHAAFTLNGEPQTVPLFRTMADHEEICIYVYFDEEVLGDVANVELVDKDGDTIAATGERVFTKTPGKGLYIAFKYNILEMEVEVENGTV